MKLEMLCTVPDAAGADVKTPPAVHGARNAVTAGREAHHEQWRALISCSRLPPKERPAAMTSKKTPVAILARGEGLLWLQATVSATKGRQRARSHRAAAADARLLWSPPTRFPDRRRRRPSARSDILCDCWPLLARHRTLRCAGHAVGLQFYTHDTPQSACWVLGNTGGLAMRCC
jgi:hypothetical protein